MNELTEKQKCYARYLAKLPAAQRNGMLANIKPSFRALLKNHIESELIVKSQSLSAAQIAQLEPLVRKMYLARLKNESPMKHAFLEPMVKSFELKINGEMRNIQEFSNSVNNCKSGLELKELLDHADDLISKKTLVIYDDEFITYSQVVNQKVKTMKMENAEC